jgi:hypothetical protein
MRTRNINLAATIVVALLAGGPLPTSASPSGDSPTSRELKPSQAPTMVAAAKPSGARPSIAKPSAAKSSLGARIVYQWHDATNQRILLRVGTYDGHGNGFGWVKIVGKHRILSINTIYFATRAPGGGVKQKNGKYRYTAYANRKVCKNNSCYYTDSVPVIAIVSRSAPKVFHGVTLDGGRIGVVTTYCKNGNNAWACPTWVDQAFAKLSTSRATPDGSAAVVSTVEFSYRPAKTSRPPRD